MGMCDILEKASILFKDACNIEVIEQNVVCITTPYLDCHNDYLQIYLYKEGSNYVLSDDSWTIEDLEQSGCILDPERRQDFLSMILSVFGVKKNKIYVKTKLENFAMAKYNLIQAILAVNDMFYLSR